MTDTLGANSCTVICKVDVLVNDVTIGSIDNILPGGSVTLDITSENMATCTFQCVDPTGLLIPTSGGAGLLQPAGVEVKIWKGFLVDGEPIWYPQGVFGVGECDVVTGAGGNDDPGPILTVDGTDRSLRISNALFNDVFTSAVGATVPEVIIAILEQQAPGVIYNIAPTTFTCAQQIYAPGTDPWACIQSIAMAAGMVAYFDPNGILVVAPSPSNGGSAVVCAIQDGPGNVANDITAVYSNNPGYNGVIVTGTNPTNDTALFGSAYDMDPTSPTYAPGPYGFVPAPPVQIATVTDNAQCTAIAQALLPQVLGLTRTVAMDTLPLPFLNAYDVAYLNSGPAAVQGSFILQLATISMDYSVLDNFTFIPVGSPISDLVANSGPSDAQFAQTSNLAAGGARYAFVNTGYKYSPFGSTYSTSSGGRLAGLEGFRLLAEPLRRILWDGSRIFRDFPNFHFGGSDWLEDADE
jgi:hypothetical protein